MFLKAKHIVSLLAAMMLCSCGGKGDTSIPVTEVSVDPQQIDLLSGDTYQLKATVLPENATEVQLEWFSDNPLIAAVSPNGLVTAVFPGSTNVHAVVGDMRASCLVNVEEKVPFSFHVEYLDGVSSEWKDAADGIYGYPGLQVQVRIAAVEDEGISYEWAVTDGECAGYSDGLMTLMNQGNTAVKVTASDGKFVEIPVNVNVSDTFQWGSAVYECGTRVSIGNTGEQTVSLLWNNGTDSVPIPAHACTIYSDSDIIEISRSENVFSVKALGIMGDAKIMAKIGEYIDVELCTVRISGNLPSNTESLEDGGVFQWKTM